MHALGAVLEDRGLRYQVVLVGGAALLLTQGTHRPTQDVDVAAVAVGDARPRVAFVLPDELAAAARDVAGLLDLPADWLNAGAAALVGDLLAGDFEDRLRSRTDGGLTISVLGRHDLLHLKVYAAADEGPGSPHLQDVRDMGPSQAELDAALAWVNSRYPGGRCPGIEQVRAALEAPK